MTEFAILRGVEYLGGHPAAPNPLANIDIEFGANEISFLKRHQVLGLIPWSEVAGIAADIERNESRITAPRVILFQIWAIFFRKHKRTAQLRIDDQRGAWVFEVPGISLGDLRSGIEQLRARHHAGPV